MSNTLKSNLKKDDFTKFFEILNSNSTFPKNTCPKNLKNLPSIPKIYFDNNNSIIDAYHRIKIKFDKLMKTKELLFFILNSEREIFQKITVPREKNFLSKNNLIPEYTEAKDYILSDKGKGLRTFNKSTNIITSLKKTSNDFLKETTLRKKGAPDEKICLFLNKIKEKKNIIKNIESNQFHPSEIFKNEFFEKNKSYFLKIFDNYQTLRNELFDEINNTNFGIMAFEYLFNTTIISQIKEGNKKLVKQLTSLKKDNNINYSQYIYINSNNNTNTLVNESISNKSKLFEKVDQYDLLYINYTSAESIKLNYKKNITDIYNNLNNSISSYAGNSFKNNLYDTLIAGINTDIYLIQFLITYIDPDLFNIIVDNDFKIKKYIQYKIDQFRNYYDSYDEWIAKFEESKAGDSDSLDKLIHFDSFLQKTLNSFFI
jgi:hypothetical protein